MNEQLIIEAANILNESVGSSIKNLFGKVGNMLKSLYKMIISAVNKVVAKLRSTRRSVFESRKKIEKIESGNKSPVQKSAENRAAEPPKQNQPKDGEIAKEEDTPVETSSNDIKIEISNALTTKYLSRVLDCAGALRRDVGMLRSPFRSRAYAIDVDAFDGTTDEEVEKENRKDMNEINALLKELPEKVEVSLSDAIKYVKNGSLDKMMNQVNTGFYDDYRKEIEELLSKIDKLNPNDLEFNVPERAESALKGYIMYLKGIGNIAVKRLNVIFMAAGLISADSIRVTNEFAKSQRAS